MQYLRVYIGRYWQVLLIFLVVSLAYGNIFDNQLIGDDKDFILTWQTSKDLSNMPALLTGDLPAVHQGTYRPLRSVLYALAYFLWQEQVGGYHLFSLAVHLGVTALVFLITRKLSKHRQLPFIAALLFGLHPIHTEAITFITASFDSAAYVCLLLSFYAFIKTHTGKVSSARWQKLGMASGIIALGINEAAVVLPLLITAYLFCYHTPQPKQLWKLSKRYWILVGGYLFLRFIVLDITSRGSYLGDSFWYAQLASLKAFLYYLYILVWPVRLGLIHTLPGGISTYLYHDLNTPAAQAQSLSEPTSIAAIMLIATAGFAIWHFKKKQPLMSLSLLWFGICLIPFINLVPSAVVLSERYIYVSSVGFIWLLSLALVNLIHRGSRMSYVGWAVVCIISALYAAKTFDQNNYWQNEIIYWETNVSDHPDHSLAWFQLGKVYQLNLMLPEAILAYEQTLDLNADYASAHYNLGAIHQYQNNPDQALYHYQKALEINPAMEEAAAGLVPLLMLQANESIQQGQWAKALEHIDQVLEISPMATTAIQARTEICGNAPSLCPTTSQ